MYTPHTEDSRSLYYDIAFVVCICCLIFRDYAGELFIYFSGSDCFHARLAIYRGEFVFGARPKGVRPGQDLPVPGFNLAGNFQTLGNFIIAIVKFWSLLLLRWRECMKESLRAWMEHKFLWFPPSLDMRLDDIWRNGDWFFVRLVFYRFLMRCS